MNWRLDVVGGFIGRVPSCPDPFRLPKVSSVLKQSVSFPIPVPSIRHLLSTQDIHQSSPTPDRTSQGEGVASPSLFGRHSAPGRKSGNLDSSPEATAHDPARVRVVNQLEKEQSPAHANHGVSRGRIKYQIKAGTTPSREAEALSPEGTEAVIIQTSTGQSMPQYPGVHVCDHTHGTHGTVVPGVWRKCREGQPN